MERNERVEALQANRLANEQWAKECQRLDHDDKELLAYKLNHEERMLAAEHALGRLQNRHNSEASRPADHRRLGERIAPQCLRDALARIEVEIERRTHGRKVTSGSNPVLLLGPMSLPRTNEEQAALARAEAAKIKLEGFYTLEKDLAPLIAKVFADLRLADGEAEQAELERILRAQPEPRKRPGPVTAKDVEAFAAQHCAGVHYDAGISAEIEP